MKRKQYTGRVQTDDFREDACRGAGVAVGP